MAAVTAIHDSVLAAQASLKTTEGILHRSSSTSGHPACPSGGAEEAVLGASCDTGTPLFPAGFSLHPNAIRSWDVLGITVG